MAHRSGLNGSNFISESNTTLSNRLKMKKSIANIIHIIFCFLLAYIFPGKAKDYYRIGKRSTVPVKAALLVVTCFILLFPAANEKTLWRHQGQSAPVTGLW